MFVHLAVGLLFTRLFRGVVNDQPMSAKKERELDAGKIAQVAAGFTGREWRSSTPVHGG